MLGARTEGYERERFCSFFFSMAEAQRCTKNVRAAFQQLVIRRAGAEVSTMGPMHSQQKYEAYAEKIDAHKKPLLVEKHVHYFAKKYGTLGVFGEDGMEHRGPSRADAPPKSGFFNKI